MNIWLNEAPKTTVPRKDLMEVNGNCKTGRLTALLPATIHLTELHHLAKILGI